MAGPGAGTGLPYPQRPGPCPAPCPGDYPAWRPLRLPALTPSTSRCLTAFGKGPSQRGPVKTRPPGWALTSTTGVLIRRGAGGPGRDEGRGPSQDRRLRGGPPIAHVPCAALRRKHGPPPHPGGPRASLLLSELAEGRGPWAHLPGAPSSPVTAVHDLLDKVHDLGHVLTDPGQDIWWEDLGTRRGRLQKPQHRWPRCPGPPPRTTPTPAVFSN